MTGETRIKLKTSIKFIFMELESILLPGISEQRPLIIAGPCSAETEEQVMTTAIELANKGIKIFRAGIWKPRTKPGGFEGVGSVGLTWLQRVKKETGMYVATEVATKNHVLDAVKHKIDVLWIGARTSVNPFAVQEIADALKITGFNGPVLIKNPVNPDLELWIGAIERIHNAGIRKIAAIHRGFSTYDKKLYRNLPQWHVPIELKRRIPNLPLIGDPSHIGGKRELIAPLSQQAMDLNYDGLIIESHCHPDSAWSDKDQQLTPDILSYILNLLVVRDTKQTTENLTELRQQIDEIDNELLSILSKRMRISQEIGQYKKEHNMPVLQTVRYDEILEKRISLGGKMGMGLTFMKTLLEAIHEESIRQQIEVLNQ
jgi:chorismate mutase